MTDSLPPSANPGAHREPAHLPSAQREGPPAEFPRERWIILENPFSNQFFRLRPAAYEFVARLRPEKTVEEVWKECLERFPDEAPGQEAVIQLLSQLYLSNLLQYDLAADSAKLFERYEKTRQREKRAKLLNVMFMRFPLLDPDQFLIRTLPVAKLLISPAGAVIWLAVVFFALKLAAENWALLRDQSQSVLSPGNLPLLYAGMILIKAIHEFGHAYFCRRFGGEVHVMGIMLMIFTRCRRGCDLELGIPQALATGASAPRV
jgi:putative peptide zinc metalloprotease protein